MAAYLCLIIALLFSFGGYAADVDKHLNFAEFKALSAQDRDAYLEDMRKLALSMEQEQRASHDDASFSGRGNVWALLLGTRAAAVPGGMCIYAGYVSQFDYRDKCVPPREMSAKSWTLTSPSGGRVQQSFCTGAGETMCNPMLYGFGSWTGSGYSGFCSKSRTTPTADCEQQYQAKKGYLAKDIASQIVSNGNEEQFMTGLDKYSKYCAGEGKTRQKSLCDLVQRRSSFLKKKLEIAKKEKEKADAEKLQAQAKPENREPAGGAVTKAALPKTDAEISAAIPPPPPPAPVVLDAPPVTQNNPPPVVTQAPPPPPKTEAVTPPPAPVVQAEPPPPPPKKKAPRQKNCFYNKETWEDAREAGEFKGVPALDNDEGVLYLSHADGSTMLTGTMRVSVTPKDIMVDFVGYHGIVGDKSESGQVAMVCVHGKTIELRGKDGKTTKVNAKTSTTMDIDGYAFIVGNAGDFKAAVAKAQAKGATVNASVAASLRGRR